MANTERAWQRAGARAARGDLPPTATESERRQFKSLSEAVNEGADAQASHVRRKKVVVFVRGLWDRHAVKAAHPNPY